MSIDVLVPRDAVVKPGSEEIVAPFRAQESDNGSSPLRTIQTNCANSPSSNTSLANASGTKLGGSKINIENCLVELYMSTLTNLRGWEVF